MIERTVGGVLGTFVVGALVVVGIWALVHNFVFESAGGLAVPTVATLVVVATFVFALFVLGARSDRWLRSPYW